MRSLVKTFIAIVTIIAIVTFRFTKAVVWHAAMTVGMITHLRHDPMGNKKA